MEAIAGEDSATAPVDMGLKNGGGFEEALAGAKLDTETEKAEAEAEAERFA